MMALEDYPLVTLKEARERHLAARQKLAAGIDPMMERKAEADTRHRNRKHGCGRLRAALRRSLAAGGSDGQSASLRAIPTTFGCAWKPTSSRPSVTNSSTM
jgi:hypothetical protein